VAPDEPFARWLPDRHGHELLAETDGRDVALREPEPARVERVGLGRRSGRGVRADRRETPASAKPGVGDFASADAGPSSPITLKSVAEASGVIWAVSSLTGRSDRLDYMMIPLSSDDGRVDRTGAVGVVTSDVPFFRFAR
jgi:hypothetical protein